MCYLLEQLIVVESFLVCSWKRSPIAQFCSAFSEIHNCCCCHRRRYAAYAWRSTRTMTIFVSFHAHIFFTRNVWINGSRLMRCAPSASLLYGRSPPPQQRQRAQSNAPCLKRSRFRADCFSPGIAAMLFCVQLYILLPRAFWPSFKLLPQMLCCIKTLYKQKTNMRILCLSTHIQPPDKMARQSSCGSYCIFWLGSYVINYIQMPAFSSVIQY